mgnify:CR=1 FL=1
MPLGNINNGLLVSWVKIESMELQCIAIWHTVPLQTDHQLQPAK